MIKIRLERFLSARFEDDSASRAVAGRGPARGLYRPLRRRRGDGASADPLALSMEFVRRLSCKVTVLHEGSVLAKGGLDHVTQNQNLIDVYLGR